MLIMDEVFYKDKYSRLVLTYTAEMRQKTINLNINNTHHK